MGDLDPTAHSLSVLKALRDRLEPIAGKRDEARLHPAEVAELYRVLDRAFDLRDHPESLVAEGEAATYILTGSFPPPGTPPAGRLDGE